MLELRPNCELCDRDLPPESPDARTARTSARSAPRASDAGVSPRRLPELRRRVSSRVRIRPAGDWRDGTGLAHDPPGDRRPSHAVHARRARGVRRDASTRAARCEVTSTPRPARSGAPFTMRACSSRSRAGSSRSSSSPSSAGRPRSVFAAGVYPPGALGRVPRAVRRAPGRAARAGRPDPRVRAVARRRPLRGPARRDRHRGERDRHDVPAGAADRRAGAKPVARAAPRLHGPGDPRLARGAGQLVDEAHDRGRGSPAAPALAARGPLDGRGAGRERAAALRRQPQRRPSTTSRPGWPRCPTACPAPCSALEVIAAAVALGLLALHISILGRGLGPVLVAAALVRLLLLVTFDLDRPTRGLIKVPATPLVVERASMELPPAASGP